MKIGFFGGCFNPPTNAHINLAKEALKICQLDKVIFMPMGDSYPKQGLAKAKDRYQMLKIACKSSKVKNLEVSDLEIKTKQRWYAIDAFEFITKCYAEDELYFMMGADNFIALGNWKESEKLRKYQYIVFERDAIDLRKMIENSDILKEYQDKIQMIQNQQYPKDSATKFRNLWASKTTKDQDIVPKEVLRFIIKNKIY